MSGTPRSRQQTETQPRPAVNSGLLTRLEWCLLWAIACTAVGGHILLAIWWQVRHAGPDDEAARHERAGRAPLAHATRLALKSLATDTPDPEALKTVAIDRDTATDDDASDQDDVSQAVEDILASRGQEPRVRRPLLGLKPVTTKHCGGTLPPLPLSHRSDADVDKRLSAIFSQASGFWAADAEETKRVSTVAEAAGGAPASCAEATYGEIQVEGLRLVLQAVVDLKDTSPSSRPPPFQAFVDLGAGVGRTAAAAVLLGFAAGAFGVELGPQRFAMGCQALANASNAHVENVMQRNIIAEPPLRVDLAHGDAREWPELTAGKWPSCGDRWAFFVGAECFRDTLLAAVGRATAQACAIGATVAVLGRRLPAELTVAGAIHMSQEGEHSNQSERRHLQERGSVLAPTTWSKGVEVFLYSVAAG